MKRLATAHLRLIVMTIVIGVFLTSQMVVAQAEGIIATAWSPDGSKIAVSGVDGLLQIRDTSNQIIRTFMGPTTDIRTVDWSPDGTKIVSGGNDGVVRVWDVSNGQPLATLTGLIAYNFQVDWSPDGNKILATGKGNPNSLIVWNASTYQQIAAVDAGQALGAHWSPDSTKIVVGQGSGYVSIYASTLGNPTTSYSIDGSVITANWSPDGTKIVAGTSIPGNDANQIKIWDVNTGNVIATYPGHTSMVGSVNFSPNGQQIASASNDGTVRVWNVATGQPIGSFAKPQSLSTSIAWSPDGTKLAYGGNDGTLQIVSVADVLSATPTLTPTATPNAQDLISLLKPAGCTTTCFIGIQPGVTTQSEVKAIFASQGVQYTIDAGINNDEPNGAYYWNMSTTGINFSTDDGSTLLYGTVTFSKGIVRQLAVGLNIPVKTIVAALGQPDAFKTDDGDYYMFYPQQGGIFVIRTYPSLSHTTSFFLVDSSAMNGWRTDNSLQPVLTCPQGTDLCNVQTATPIATVTPMGIQ